MRYEKLSDGTWQQRCAPVAEVEVPLEVVDLSAVPAEELHDAILKTAADSQRTLNIEHGPLFKAVYIDLGADRGARLLLVVHHLVMDMISWRILFEDLQTPTSNSLMLKQCSYGPRALPTSSGPRTESLRCERLS